jgi:hypothetical protein
MEFVVDLADCLLPLMVRTLCTFFTLIRAAVLTTEGLAVTGHRLLLLSFRSAPPLDGH